MKAMKLFSAKQSGITLSAAIGLSLLGGGSAPAVYAEQASGRVLEEVIVTARRKMESIQDVPISMTVLDQQQINAANLSSAGDLSLITHPCRAITILVPTPPSFPSVALPRKVAPPPR